MPGSARDLDSPTYGGWYIRNTGAQLIGCRAFKNSQSTDNSGRAVYIVNSAPKANIIGVQTTNVVTVA